MVLNAAVQALKQAEELKQKVLLENSNASNPNKTLAVAQLQKAYQNILLMDLDFALNRKVEQDLWNVGFKNQIEFLQNNAKDKKNSRRADSQTLLSLVLQSTTGFYICFLHQICNAFKIDLPFRCDIPYMESDVNFQFTIKPPQSSSCWYIIQHCLVHLGDLARYNRQTRRADSFYRQALNVSPRNGQPYNQLGLLRAARGDRLGAAYYHARGVAVGGPFPPAANNLARTLASASTFNAIPQKKSKSPDFESSGFSSITRLNSQSYINSYISVHYQLQSGNDLINTDGNISELNSTLIALVATDEFTHDVLLKMCCLDLYALYSITEGYKIDCSSLSEDEKNIFSLLMKLIAGSLTALLLPAHTRAPQELVTYSALPAIKLIFEWICLQPDALKHQAFISRPQLWPGLCTLLNNLQDAIKEFPGEDYKTLPLPEDDELQGFLPIDRAFLNLKFDEKSHYQQTDKEDEDNEKNSVTSEQVNSKMTDVLQKHCILKSKSWQSPSPERALLNKKDPNFFNSLRAHRLTHIGEWLSSYLKENGMECLNFSFDSEKNLKTFTPIQNSLENSEVLKTIQELALLREKHLNEANTQKNSVVSQEDEGDMSDSDMKNDSAIKTSIEEDISTNEINLISEADFREKVREKRAGILKPQGSLEKARGEKALSRSCRIDVASPELLKTLNDTTIDVSDVQDTGSSSSTVSQDGTIYSDIGSLLDPPILINDKPISKKEGKKTRTNVAMQAIMRKQEESSKQVKFLTPATTPDSVTESFDISTSENKNQIEKRKIIQPKVLKSLNCLPTDRKTGGILSLKDKSAGYPHLVNIETSSTEIEKSDHQEDAASKDETSSKATIADSVTSKDIEKSKTSPGHKPAKNIEITPRHQDSFKQLPYMPWSDGNPNNRPFTNPEDWKSDHNSQNLNIGQNNPGCYSYFPTPSAAQKIHNSGISLPVVNPKEIDVRSISTQRQRNSQMPMNDPQYGNFPNKQYDSNLYNCWNSFDSKDDAKFSNLPPRLANYKNPGNMYNPPDRNFPNIPPDNRNFDAQNQSTSGSWWTPVEPKSMPNFQPNNPMIRNPANFNYQTMNQNQPYMRYNEASPNVFQPPPYNSNFNPYQQQQQPSYNYPHGMYGNMGMPQNVQTPIGGEFLHNNPDAYGMLQNLNSNRNVPFMPEMPKQSPFNADIPEFVPRTVDSKNPATPSKDSGNTSIYSLFSGPESPWQTKNSKSPGENTAQQSVWPGSGPSPLERLLEQQKQFKYPPTDS